MKGKRKTINRIDSARLTLLPVLAMLLLLLSPALSIAQSKSQIRDRKIKSTTILWDDSRKGSVEKKSQTSKYDKHGNTIEEIEYNTDGSIDRWVKYLYDKHSKTYLRLDSAGTVTKKVLTIYDKWRNAIEQITYDRKESITERIVSEYNNFNDQTAETIYDGSGKQLRKSVYEYDTKGLLKCKNIYDENGKLIYTRTYTYEY